MKLKVGVSSILVLVLMLAGAASASAWRWRDRTPPSPPTNLHVDDVGTDFVALDWGVSFDWSFHFSYRVYRSGQSQPVIVPQSQSAYTWSGLDDGTTYTFFVEAVDGSGNVSDPSNTVTVTTLNENDQPPSAPSGLSITEVTPRSVSLSWDAATDDFGVSRYIVVNGGFPYGSQTATGETSATVSNLEYETTYSFAVVAEDTAGQQGPPSETVMATTLESDDVTPPSPPGSLDAAPDAGCGNFLLDWSESRDDIDRQYQIRYDVYMDDGLDPVDSITGDFFIELHVDIEPNSTHSFYLRAVDTSGNVSAPSNVDTATDICN